jgi:hypothetical protein
MPAEQFAQVDVLTPKRVLGWTGRSAYDSTTRSKRLPLRLTTSSAPRRRLTSCSVSSGLTAVCLSSEPA